MPERRLRPSAWCGSLQPWVVTPGLRAAVSDYRRISAVVVAKPEPMAPGPDATEVEPC